MMQDTIIQLVLAICGLTALYLSTGFVQPSAEASARLTP